MMVSAIIPSCQPGQYLENCLNSIVNQDFNKDDFEVVIALNGPKQPYLERIKQFVQGKGISFRILYTPVKSVSVARNLALNSVSSDYVLFIDDDDLISENFISSLFSVAVLDTVAVGNWKTFYNDPADLSENYVSRAYRKCEHGGSFSLYSYRTFLSSCCGKLIPLNVIGNYRFNERLTVHEDAMFMFAISRKIKMMKLAESDAFYINRQRSDSASRRVRPAKIRIINFFKVIWAYSGIYFSNPLKYSFLLYLSRIAGTVKFYLFKAIKRT